MKKSTLFRFYRLLAPIFALLILTGAAYPYFFTQFSTHVPLGDSPDVLYIVSIIQHTILSPISQIYHLPVYYPKAHTLTFGHPLFGLSLFFKGFSLLGLSMTQSYNLYVILALILGSWGCYLLATELTGRPILSMACTALPLFWANNRMHFFNLNFLSWFASAFVFLFLVRFVRSGRWRHALLTGLACFYLFFCEIYYGLHMWVFLLPVFLLACLALRLLDRHRLVMLLAILALATLLVALAYFPFADQIREEKLSRSFDASMLLDPQTLFAGNTLLLAMQGLPHGGSHFFPGLIAAAALLAFLTSRLPRYRHLALGLSLSLLIACSYLQLVHLPALELLFLFTLLLLAFFAILAWPRLESLEKVFFITALLFFGLMIHFPHLPLLKSLAPYRWFHSLVPGMSGLRAVGRVCFPMLMPLLTAMATLGIGHQFGLLKNASRPEGKGARLWLHRALPMLIAAGIYLENVTLKYPMQPLPRPSSAYSRLPRDCRAVIFEYPWDYVFHKYYVNGLYMLAWQRHRQPILNGRSAFFPDRYIDGIYSFLGYDLAAFPEESQLQRLAEDYGVSHVIVHWDLLRRLYADQPNLSQAIRERLRRISRWGRISFQSRDATILELVERFPLQRMTRTYAGYDLASMEIEIRLHEEGAGKVRLLVNGQAGPEPATLGVGMMRWDLRSLKLRPDGNRLEWIFPSPVKVRSVRLINR